jgi:hypothetical protein
MNQVKCLEKIYEYFNEIEQCIFEEKHSRNEKTKEEKELLLSISESIETIYSDLERYLHYKKSNA